MSFHWRSCHFSCWEFLALLWLLLTHWKISLSLYKGKELTHISEGGSHLCRNYFLETFFPPDFANSGSISYNFSIFFFLFLCHIIIFWGATIGSSTWPFSYSKITPYFSANWFLIFIGEEPAVPSAIPFKYWCLFDIALNDFFLQAVLYYFTILCLRDGSSIFIAKSGFLSYAATLL